MADITVTPVPRNLDALNDAARHQATADTALAELQATLPKMAGPEHANDVCWLCHHRKPHTLADHHQATDAGLDDINRFEQGLDR